jgi:hypothetical protein
MSHIFQEAREVDETLTAACLQADEWVSKTKHMPKAEFRIARAYLRAKQNYLDKVDAILDILIERGADKDEELAD